MATSVIPQTINAYQGAGYHNSIFRGKNLGTTFTKAQSDAIKAGTFDDLYVGDCWVINGVTWRIAGFDWYFRCCDVGLWTHHIAVVPDTPLYNAAWNDTNTTANGYVGSKIRANIKSGTNGSAEGAELKVIAAFGSDHVLSYRGIYPTTYSGGAATGWAWTDARVELMSENEVFGVPIWSSTGYETGINARQLPLFQLAPQFVTIMSGGSRAGWWLRSVNSASYACLVSATGFAGAAGVSLSSGVRPLSVIA